MPYRILIADDHNQLRETLKAALEGHSGWHVCAEAINGLEAVQKAAEFKPDVIILDLSMPVMGGMQAAREILTASPDMPILLFTNHAVSAVALDAQKAGIRQVISKTYEWDEILKAVESLLNEKSSGVVRLLQADSGKDGVVILTDNQQKPQGSLKPSGDTVLPE